MKLLMIAVMCMSLALPLHSYAKDPHCEGHQEDKPHKHGPQCKGNGNPQQPLKEGFSEFLPPIKPEYPLPTKASCKWERANQGELTAQPVMYFIKFVVPSPNSVQFISDNYITVNGEAYRQSIYRSLTFKNPNISILYDDTDKDHKIIEMKWFTGKGKSYFWNNKFYDNDKKEPYAKSKCNELS